MVITPFMPSAPLIYYYSCSGVLAEFWYLSWRLVGLHSNNCFEASFCLSDYHPSLGKDSQKKTAFLMGIAQIGGGGNAQKRGWFFCDSFPQRASLLGSYHFNSKCLDKTRWAENNYKKLFLRNFRNFGRNGLMANGWLIKNIHQRQTGRNKKL